MSPATVDLIRAIGRILRAAANEADAIAEESAPARRTAEIRTSGRPVSDIARRRALAACERAGLSVDYSLCDRIPEPSDPTEGSTEPGRR